MVRLVRDGVLPEGSLLTLQPTTEFDSETRDLVAEWVAEDPRRGRARWVEDAKTPLEWEYDGQRYRPTTIVKTILQEAADVHRGANGPLWWVTDSGLTLTDLARQGGDADN